MNCTYLGHAANATHFYDTTEGVRKHLCIDCAGRFGYPQYLTEINPKPPIAQAGYVVETFDGEGESDPVIELWPFESEVALAWIQALTGVATFTVEWLLADAQSSPYEPQYQEAGGWLTLEVRKVTCLRLI
ncbi:hypothetical protein [Streptomyces sp. NRRL F-5123]|uniref:hypothetical protein n=1 Tax=Streptomyces sp. NRRL F-5123 TaxID=1463856 RepID=UPI000693DDDF|nr:hypothetical protein [Streptomyces sp. NRRL F-5123]